MKINKPNFFIVGAPKCGTTSLAHYLSLHPEIFISIPKEPLFFCDDHEHHEPWRVAAREDYLALFAEASDAQIIGEGSVWYLYSQTAAKNIREFNPDSRIIIMLRNPVDMMHSLHAQFISSGNENIREFRNALAAQPDRTKGIRIPKRAHFPRGLLYTEVAKYSKQVERYIDEFGTNKVQIVIFEHFFRNIEQEYKQILNFLSIDNNFSPDFELKNPRKSIRSILFQRWLLKPPMDFWNVRNWLPSGRIADGLQWRVNAAYKKLLDLNTKHDPPETMDPFLKNRLWEELEEDVQKLGRIIGTDLSVWKPVQKSRRKHGCRPRV